ncbi:MAG: hypothetical protein DRJ56_03030 [Thermoprotei archaeon]|nr:MAG: hypothetical protein DRJ56_03030 [Thermoprotei archaeon]
MSGELEVTHLPQLGKFLVRLSRGKYAFVEYEVRGKLLYVTKAHAPEEFRGRGIASRVMAEVARYAERDGFDVSSLARR